MPPSAATQHTASEHTANTHIANTRLNAEGAGCVTAGKAQVLAPVITDGRVTKDSPLSVIKNGCPPPLSVTATSRDESGSKLVHHIVRCAGQSGNSADRRSPEARQSFKIPGNCLKIAGVPCRAQTSRLARKPDCPTLRTIQSPLT